MRRRVSEAWQELGNVPADEARDTLNAEEQVRAAAHQVKRILPPQPTTPLPRADAKSAFARMHSVIDAGGEA
jgi:hypothetical protein